MEERERNRKLRELKKSELFVYIFIKNKPYSNRNAVSFNLDMDKCIVSRHLNNMIELGVIERTPDRPYKYYVID